MCTSRRPSSHSHSKFSFRLRTFFKPRMLIIAALLTCWDLQNSMAVSFYPNQNRNQDHIMHHYHQSGGVRLRVPTSLNQLSSSDQSMLPLGGAGLMLSDETAAAIAGPVIRSPSALVPYSAALDTKIGEVLSGAKRKKDCGEPSIATRGLLGSTLKRSYFAFTQDEVDQKLRDDEYREAAERRKRDVQQLFQTSKRSGVTGGGEAQESALPWTCETKYEWKDMGADHYPRFVRTAECKSRLCFNGFLRCRPRRYKTKVLKRVTPADSTSCEDDDVSLPETLRANWKFITVTINLCCDCTGRIPGNTEV